MSMIIVPPNWSYLLQSNWSGSVIFFDSADHYHLLNKFLLPTLLRHSLSSRGIDFCVIIINVKSLLLMHRVAMLYSSQEKENCFFASEACTWMMKKRFSIAWENEEDLLQWDLHCLQHTPALPSDKNIFPVLCGPLGTWC